VREAALCFSTPAIIRRLEKWQPGDSHGFDRQRKSVKEKQELGGGGGGSGRTALIWSRKFYGPNDLKQLNQIHYCVWTERIENKAIC
jgi:hypothetical protein